MVIPTIRKLGTFDHNVLQMFRPQPDTEGYGTEYDLSLIHISEPTRLVHSSRMTSSA